MNFGIDQGEFIIHRNADGVRQIDSPFANENVHPVEVTRTTRPILCFSSGIPPEEISRIH